MGTWIYTPNTSASIWTGCTQNVVPGGGGEVNIFTGSIQQLLPRGYNNIAADGGLWYQRFVVPFPQGVILCDEVTTDPSTGKCCLLQQRINVGALISYLYYQIFDCSPHMSGAIPPGLSWNPDVWFLLCQLMPCR